MSSTKKPLKKRKRQSPPAPTTTKLHRRLELRTDPRNLWNDTESVDNDSDADCYVQPKAATSNKTYIVLSDSDEDKPASRPQSKNRKATKKPHHVHEESGASEDDYETPSKCATCLICSILSTLTSYNCCSRHLAVLKREKRTARRRLKLTTHTEPHPAQHVMILPMTDELIQRYLNPQGVHHLRSQISSAENPNGSHKSTRKVAKKSATTSEPSDPELPIRLKSSMKSAYVEPDQSNSSPVTLEGGLPNTDATFTVISSSSTTINSFESPNMLDTCQLQNSSDQPIVIDESQPASTATTTTITQSKQCNPWNPVSDQTYAAIEVVLNQDSQLGEELTEFTPATARRTSTNLMAACLPKIQLRTGRFRQGKPVADKAAPDTTTSECGSSTNSQLSSVSRTASVTNTSTRAPPALPTIAEDESVVIPPASHSSERTLHPPRILSQRQDNIGDGLSDTVMSCLFAQDDASQHDHVSLAACAIPNSIPVPMIVVEDYSRRNENNRSEDISQSSQLSNDQNGTQLTMPSGPGEKTSTTPARISYRTNPDGSRVSISRPPLSAAHQSPAISTRRTSTDVTSSTPHPSK